MSRQEIERFATDLKSNAALRAEAEAVQAGASNGFLLATAVSFAARRGYRFTVEEAKAHTRERAQAVGRTLDDAELDGPSGGPCWYWSILLVGEQGQSAFDHGRYWSVGPLRT
ncbi:Nif11-like leader peptide family natural product precursor [Reyranella sp.]|uniref:Nif11-like leader peptide family natural product precursor n=1 Tax=Reyranella sp. TaxID=1929291 RepID=UPI003BAC366C